MREAWIIINGDGINFNEGKQNDHCIQEVMNCLNVFLFLSYISQIKFPVVTIYTVDRNKIFLSCTHMATYMRKALDVL